MYSDDVLHTQLTLGIGMDIIHDGDGDINLPEPDEGMSIRDEENGQEDSGDEAVWVKKKQKRGRGAQDTGRDSYRV